jgi:hypothetical protein
MLTLYLKISVFVWKHFFSRKKCQRLRDGDHKQSVYNLSFLLSSFLKLSHSVHITDLFNIATVSQSALFAIVNSIKKYNMIKFFLTQLSCAKICEVETAIRVSIANTWINVLRVGYIFVPWNAMINWNFCDRYPLRIDWKRQSINVFFFSFSTGFMFVLGRN